MRPFIFLLIAFLFAANLHAQTAVKENPVYSQALDLMKAGKYKKAKKLLDKAIMKAVNDPELYSLRSECFMGLDDRTSAIGDITVAIKLAPDTFRYRLNRGAYYNSIAQFSKADNDFARALSLAKDRHDSVVALSNRGPGQMRLGDTAKAIATMELALKLDSTDIAALTNYGMMLNDAGRSMDAIACLQRVIRIDSTNVPAYSNIGFCYSNVGQYDKAIPYFDKCIQLDPKEPFPYNNRGYCKLKTGDLDGAMKDVQKSISLFPQNSYAYRNLGLIYLAKGDSTNACKAFDQALQYGFTEIYGREVLDLKKKNCE